MTIDVALYVEWWEDVEGGTRLHSQRFVVPMHEGARVRSLALHAPGEPWRAPVAWVGRMDDVPEPLHATVLRYSQVVGHVSEDPLR